MTGLTAIASTTIDAGRDATWKALTEPAEVKQWLLGTCLPSDWKPASRITWSGVRKDKPHQDKGELVAVDVPSPFEVTHFSPLTRREDKPENYHALGYPLDDAADGTEVTITQDKNADQDEADRNAATWPQMLEALSSTSRDAEPARLMRYCHPAPGRPVLVGGEPRG